jgi:hypothetical protein
MSEFMFLFRSTAAEAEQAMGTPEQAQRSMQSFMLWLRELQAKGQLKNPGQPLERTGKVVRGSVITDGPYVEAKDLVLGYLIVEAHDLTQAAEIALGCPMALGGAVVEVRPIMTEPF